MAASRFDAIVAVGADDRDADGPAEGSLAPRDGRLALLASAVNFSLLPSPGGYSGRVMVISSEPVPSPDAEPEAAGGGRRP